MLSMKNLVSSSGFSKSFFKMAHCAIFLYQCGLTIDARNATFVNMKICLVGSILRHTVLSDAGTYSGWGGMTESAVAPFAALLDNSSTIYFVGSVGKDDIDEVREFYRKNYPLVDASGIHVNPTGTDHHHGNKHFVRRKVQVEPTRYEHIKPYIHDADVVIFNFGNIDDIDPEAIKKVKESSKALVYVDVHRKPFGADKEGFMYTRGWPGWEKYLKYADVVQMDKNECGALFGTKLKNIRDVIGCAKKVLDAGAGQALMTLGAKGILLAHKTPAYEYIHIPPAPCNVLDTTGSGDALAAGYLVKWHEGGSVIDAVKMGSLMGALNCEFVGYMKNIKRVSVETRMPADFNHAKLNPQDEKLTAVFI